MISVYGMEPEESGISVVMPKTDVFPSRLAPEGSFQLQWASSPSPQERERYCPMETHEAQTARVSYGVQVQLPVEQSTAKAFEGSEAENIPLYTAAFMGSMGTKLSEKILAGRFNRFLGRRYT